MRLPNFSKTDKEYVEHIHTDGTYKEDYLNKTIEWQNKNQSEKPYIVQLLTRVMRNNDEDLNLKIKF